MHYTNLRCLLTGPQPSSVHTLIALLAIVSRVIVLHDINDDTCSLSIGVNYLLTFDTKVSDVSYTQVQPLAERLQYMHEFQLICFFLINCCCQKSLLCRLLEFFLEHLAAKLCLQYPRWYKSRVVGS